MLNNFVSMKRSLLVLCLVTVFFSCKKTDDTRTEAVYSKAVPSMGFAYNKTYMFYFQRTVGGVSTLDSDRVLFRANGTVTEVSHRYDITSHTYPDSLTYVVNASFDDNINWMQIPSAQVFSFYPIHDSVRGFLLHDYLNNSVVTLARVRYDNASDKQLNVIHALPDSTSYVDGYVKPL